MKRLYTPPTPASLLFENLAYDCKTDDERNAVIHKIAATTDGADTIVAARDYAKEKIAALDATIAQLENEFDDLEDRGITNLPVFVLTNHKLKQANSDKIRFAPIYTAALTSLEDAINTIKKSSTQSVDRRRFSYS